MHTYLYPLSEHARFLWRVGRADVADLFGDFDPSHRGGLSMHTRLADEMVHARAVIHRLIENAPRVCLGRGYTIPYSQIEGARGTGPLHHTTGLVTYLLWNAPMLDDFHHGEAMRVLGLAEDVPDRDSAEEIDAFLTAHAGQHIIPVWM